jgi:regulator of replication initiation timing
LEAKLGNATKENELLQKENEQLKCRVQELEAQVENSAPTKDRLPVE